MATQITELRLGSARPQWRVTVGTPGAPARGDDRLVARPRTRENALVRGRTISVTTEPNELAWVWEKTRPRTWECIATFQGGSEWERGGS